VRFFWLETVVAKFVFDPNPPERLLQTEIFIPILIDFGEVDLKIQIFSSSGVNFINMLTGRFYSCRSPKCKNPVENKLTNLWSCCTLRSTLCATRLVKLTHGFNFINIYQAAFAPIFFSQKIQSQTLIREKLHKKLLYKKGKSKMLMKLTTRGWCYKHFWTPSLGVWTPKS